MWITSAIVLPLISDLVPMKPVQKFWLPLGGALPLTLLLPTVVLAEPHPPLGEPGNSSAIVAPVVTLPPPPAPPAIGVQAESKPAPEPPPAVTEESAPVPQPWKTTGTSTPTPETAEAPSQSPSEEAPAEAQKPGTETEAEKPVEKDSRFLTLAQADQLYLAGDRAAAEALYRQVKSPFEAAGEVKERPAPLLNPEELSPGGRVFWREAEEGIAQNQDSRTLVALNLLVEKHPEFVPGQLRLAELLVQRDRGPEALAVLERAGTLYPDQPELVRARVEALAKAGQPLEASIVARQYALLNPEDSLAPDFLTLADTNLEHHQRKLRRQIRNQAIGNVLTGVVGYVLTGNLFGPLSAIQTTTLLLQGESAVGERVSRQAQARLEMVEDALVTDYVNELGQKLAQAGGRTDFQYAFFVVMDEDLNAFALPGGKVFINAGAIVKTNSEAELAGLIAHELAHAILSHGFQLVTRGNLTANLTQFFPFGGLVGDLVVLDYSRDMERQADILGTRLLAATGYAADGLRNLMITMEKEERRPIARWLSTHPFGSERIRYLETLITENGYNRYAFEGVERHGEVRQRVQELLAEYKKRGDDRRRRR